MLVGGAEGGLLHRLDREACVNKLARWAKKNVIGLFAEQRRIGQWWRTENARLSPLV
jgi:hypothetical protein